MSCYPHTFPLCPCLCFFLPRLHLRGLLGSNLRDCTFCVFHRFCSTRTATVPPLSASSSLSSTLRTAFFSLFCSIFLAVVSPHTWAWAICSFAVSSPSSLFCASAPCCPVSSSPSCISSYLLFPPPCFRVSLFTSHPLCLLSSPATALPASASPLLVTASFGPFVLFLRPPSHCLPPSFLLLWLVTFLPISPPPRACSFFSFSACYGRPSLLRYFFPSLIPLSFGPFTGPPLSWPLLFPFFSGCPAHLPLHGLGRVPFSGGTARQSPRTSHCLAFTLRTIFSPVVSLASLVLRAHLRCSGRRILLLFVDSPRLSFCTSHLLYPSLAFDSFTFLSHWVSLGPWLRVVICSLFLLSPLPVVRLDTFACCPRLPCVHATVLKFWHHRTVASGCARSSPSVELCSVVFGRLPPAIIARPAFFHSFWCMRPTLWASSAEFPPRITRGLEV